MKYATLVVLLLCSLASAEEAKPCLLVRPTEGIQTIAGRIGGKYEYVDSVNLAFSDQKMNYKKSQLEKLQKQGVHIVLVPRDAVRNQIQQARESCTTETASK